MKLDSEALNSIKQSLDTLEQEITPVLKSLTAQERLHMIALGDASYEFTSKSYEFGIAKQPLVADYVDVPAMGDALNAERELRAISRRLDQLLSGVNDSAYIAGSSAYSAALVVYSTLKHAASHNVTGTKAMANELKSRFKRQRKNAASNESVNTGTTETEIREASA